MIYSHTSINEASVNLKCVFSTVMSLKCKVCSSVNSWDDCKGEDTTCLSGMADRCVKAYVKYGDTEGYGKYCGMKDYCDKDKNPTCNLAKAFGASECTVNCCEGDLCNAGSAARISGIVLVAWAMVLLVFQNA